MTATFDDQDILLRAEKVVRERFGFSGLRTEQAHALAPILRGQDTVVVMPTGRGKSLCFQVPGLLDEGKGPTVVISPLIALMKDQVDALNARGFRAATLNSSMDPGERADVMARLRRREVNFLYVAPERLLQPGLLALLKDVQVRRVAVDEAHCASEWGHDFRPDYLKIGEFLDHIGRPSCIALTATATPEVRDDIVAILGLRDAAVIVAGFDRPNIACSVVRARGDEERIDRLIAAFDAFDPKDGTALVYAGSRKNTETVAATLVKFKIRCGVYHAGLSAEERTRVQEDFIAGRLRTVVATNAFGMGIDRSDVRLVVHWDLPGSLEAYYQEIGRAGRDGLDARAVLIFAEQSVRLQEFFLDLQHPTMTTIRAVLSRLQRDGDEAHDAETLVAHFKNEKDAELRHGAHAALSQLIIANIVARSPDGRLTVNPERAKNLRDLIDEDALERRRELGRSKLAAMVGYGRRRACRRNVILDYFEAERDQGTCGRCDDCRAHPGTEEPLNENDRTVMKKILAGVARAKGYAGRQKIVGMLTGSKAKDVAGTWLVELSTYGILAGHSRDFIEACLDAVIDARLVEIRGDERPVLGLTEAGWDAMNGRAEPAVRWPIKKGAVSHAAARPAKKTGGRPIAAAGGDFDLDLLDRLRRWRHETAAAKRLPAYIVMNNASIEDVAAKRPRSLAELALCRGFGPQRIAKYGEEILSVIETGS